MDQIVLEHFFRITKRLLSTLFLFLLLGLWGCGHDKQDLPKNGKIKIKRVARFYDDYDLNSKCKYIYGYNECKSFADPENIDRHFPGMSLDSVNEMRFGLFTSSLLINKIFRLNYLKEGSDKMVDRWGDRLYKAYKYNHPDIPFSEAIREDSLKYYGKTYFKGEDRSKYRSPLLINILEFEEEVEFKEGEEINRELQKVSFGYEAYDFSRRVLILTFAESEMDTLFNLSINGGYAENPNIPAAYSPQLDLFFPYFKLTLKELYQRHWLYLNLVEVNGVPADSTLKAKYDHILNPLHKPVADSFGNMLEAEIGLICQVQEPRAFFRGVNSDLQKDELLKNTYGPKYNYESYRRNLELCDNISNELLRHCIMKIKAGELKTYDPKLIDLELPLDSLNKLVTETFLLDDISDVLSTKSHLELIEGLTIRQGNADKSTPSHIKFAVYPKVFPFPTNFFVVKTSDIAEIWNQNRPGYDFTYKEILSKYAFKTIFNIDGFGVRTLDEANQAMKALPQMFPQKLPDNEN